MLGTSLPCKRPMVHGSVELLARRALGLPCGPNAAVAEWRAGGAHCVGQSVL